MASLNYVADMPLGKLVNREILESSREKYRTSHLSAAGQPYDKIVVGAAAFRQFHGTVPAILLLKRAAHETYFPNVFELPSGKVDTTDLSIKQALMREMKEETGSDVTGIVAELDSMTYCTEKRGVDATGNEMAVSKNAIQLSYIVSISDGDVEVNKNEHSESIWATEEEADGLNITSAMSAVVKEAYKWTSTQQQD